MQVLPLYAKTKTNLLLLYTFCDMHTSDADEIYLQSSVRGHDVHTNHVRMSFRCVTKISSDNVAAHWKIHSRNTNMQNK